MAKKRESKVAALIVTWLRAVGGYESCKADWWKAKEAAGNVQIAGDQIISWLKKSNFDPILLAENESKLRGVGLLDRSYGREFLRKVEQHYGLTQKTSPAGNESWSQPDSPTTWAKRLGNMSLSTLKRRIDRGDIHVKKVTSKSWRIRTDDLAKYSADVK